jgi:hypothetical protein
MRIKIFLTTPIIFIILNSFPKDTSVYIHYDCLTLSRKLKSIVVLFLFGSLFLS